MVELRKRKDPPSNTTAAPSKKSTPSAAAAKKNRGDDRDQSNPEGSTDTVSSGKLKTGDTIKLQGFGGEIETNDGEKTTLEQLVDRSQSGVVLFTYPKASTPGCTTQACLFRDNFTPLTATGFSIFGLSSDSPKSNSNFKQKQSLPFQLLCDPGASLIGAIGMKKSPKGTIRGVFVVGKTGRVEAVEPGGPAATVDVVRKLIQGQDGSLEETAQSPTEGEKGTGE
ncbi:MAG: hypothetical protein Q9214_007076 [Letrouitia sp. 1 TL-2023]